MKVGDRDRRDDPEAADQRPDDLGRDRLVVQDRTRRLVADVQHDDQRQAHADVGEEQGVDGGTDVRAADPHRAHDQRRAAQVALLRELLDEHGLSDGDVVEHADRPEDDRREEDAAQVEAGTARNGHEREV